MDVDHSKILTEKGLPDVEELLKQGHDLSQDICVGSCPFLLKYNVRSEIEFKQKQMAKRKIMLHAQVGYRSLSELPDAKAIRLPHSTTALAEARLRIEIRVVILTSVEALISRGVTSMRSACS
ncbi:MAG: hypothetical protein ACFFC7_16845 [Candidatus Hermodarchaeota archaeon]